MIKLNYHKHNLENGYIRLELNLTTDNAAIIVNSPDNIMPLLKTLNSIQFDKITALILQHCSLITVPNNLGCLNLIELDIAFNKIHCLPNWLLYSKLKLQIFNVSHNLLENIDVAPQFCKFLRALDLSSNNLNKIPVWLYSSLCVELESLNLSLNPFDTTLSFLTGRYLKKLKYLKMNNCYFKLIFIRLLKQLPSLQKLSICNDFHGEYLNNIEKISFNSFHSVANLTEINLSGLSSSVLLDEISHLTNLVKLDISYNYLSWLPEQITSLISLKILNANHNELLYLPSNLNKLANLTELHVSHNLIGVLPDAIYKLTKLETLDCYSNDIVVNLGTFLSQMLALKAVDLEQNAFLTNDDQRYVAKRDLLRLNTDSRDFGLKFGLENLSDDDYSVKSSLSDDYEVEQHGGLTEPVDDAHEETWECEEFDNDDFLVLPPFRFKLAAKRTIARVDPVDPECFADSPDDHT